jgi:hypothetical protein
MKIEPGISEEINSEKREIFQEKALWYMQRLGPRIKAKLRQIMYEDQDDLRITPFKLINGNPHRK